MLIFKSRWLLAVLVTAALLGSAPEYAMAAVLSLSGPGAALRRGDVITVTAFLDTGNDAINAVAGTIEFPDFLKLKKVDTGASLIAWWVEEPRSDRAAAAGRRRSVQFSGLLAGAVSTRQGKLFSLSFDTAGAGAAAARGLIQFVGATTLKGDGRGTPATVQVKGFTFSMGSAGPVTVTSSAEAEEPLDTAPPDPFTAFLTRASSIFDNQWFVAFAAQDQGSGVDYYEVQEAAGSAPEESLWQRAQNPYLVLDQSLNKTVYLRAVDKAGNSRQITVAKPSTVPTGPFWYIILGINLVLAGLAVGLVLTNKIWRRRRTF